MANVSFNDTYYSSLDLIYIFENICFKLLPSGDVNIDEVNLTKQ